MGMYDYVNFKTNCPKCGTELSAFQTKDANCNLDWVDPVAINNFYTSCKCGNWIEFNRNILPEPEKAREEPYTIGEVTALGFTLDKGL